MKVHNSCTTLPLAIYIRCQLGGDLKELTIEGEPTTEELKTAWQAITQEFFDLSEDKQANYELGLLTQIEILNIKIITIQQSVEILKKYRCDELVDILHKLGYRFPFNIDNEKEYLNDLKRVIDRAKILVIQLKDKQAELAVIAKNKDSSEKVGAKYYDKILSILSQYMKHHIDEYKTTVSRYAAMLNMYIAHNEQLNLKGS